MPPRNTDAVSTKALTGRVDINLSKKLREILADDGP